MFLLGGSNEHKEIGSSGYWFINNLQVTWSPWGVWMLIKFPLFLEKTNIATKTQTADFISPESAHNHRILEG